MPNSQVFLIPLFAGTVAVALLAFECGLRLGKWRKERPDPEPPLPVRALVGSILSLLSFILGFLFGSAASNVDSRGQTVFDESIAIGTAYRRADLLHEPERTVLRGLLRQYVDARIEITDAEDKRSLLPKLRGLQEQIWSQAVDIARMENGQPSNAPLLQSLIDVIDVHGERVLATDRSRIPTRVWIALYWIMSLSLAAAGYQSGMAGARRSIAAVGYALVFSTVIVMVAAGDQPDQEQYRKNAQALVELRTKLTTPVIRRSSR